MRANEKHADAVSSAGRWGGSSWWGGHGECVRSGEGRESSALGRAKTSGKSRGVASGEKGE
jgi:hypothetical protein